MLPRNDFLLRLFGLFAAFAAVTLLNIPTSHDAHARGGMLRFMKGFHDGKKAGEEMRSQHDEEDGSARANSARPGLPDGDKDDDKAAGQSASGTGEPAATPAPATVAKVNSPKKHPLAEPYPDMDVVVCEAGCANESQQVVYMQPTSKTMVVAEVKPTAAADGGAAEDPNKDMIVCLGGCYDTPRVYTSVISEAKAKAAQWQPTVVPASSGEGNASGDWMRRIDKIQNAPGDK